MSLEIFVGGDIEKALARLKRNYQGRNVTLCNACNGLNGFVTINRHRRFRDEEGQVGLGSLRD
jgi:hypothetical protein